MRDEQYEQPREITVFVEENDDDLSQPFEPYGYYEPPKPRRLRPLILFLLTCVSTTFAGAMMCGPGYALQFSGAVMLILFFHEMGHYIQTRRYGVPASLPYFIPFFPPLGTMGAVILQHAGYANRKATFDIGISGPLAGLVVALPIAWFGCQQAQYFPIPENFEGLVFADPPILQWMLEVIHGPKPDGMDVDLRGNPLLYAGWIGVFLTALNLIPIGQLDGGHVLYTIIGRRAHFVSYALLGGAIVYSVSVEYYNLLPMVVLLVLFGPRHPPTVDDTVPLGWPRVLLGLLTLCFLFVGIDPQPIRQIEANPPAQQQPVEPSAPRSEQMRQPAAVFNPQPIG